VQLSKDLRKKLVSEFRYCAEKMSKEKDFRKKVFFFSSTEEVVSSAINFEYDPQLVLIELVLDVATGTIAHRIDMIQSEKDTSIEIIDGLFDKLYACLNELAVSLEENQDTYKTLEKIAELAHATTDKGYYLYTKGLEKT